MDEMHNFVIDTQAAAVCPAIDAVVAVTPSAVNPADFTGLSTTVSWVAVFLDGAYFPGFFVAAFGLFLLSFFANFIIRLIRLIWQLIPVA